MKALKVQYNGKGQAGWKAGPTKAINVTVGQKPRKVTGWTIISPDGCERFCEGNYQQFVPFANMVLANYGVTTRIS